MKPLTTADEIRSIECLFMKVGKLDIILPSTIIDVVMKYREMMLSSLSSSADEETEGLLSSESQVLSSSELSAFVAILKAVNPKLLNEFLLACKELLPNLICAITASQSEEILHVGNPMSCVGKQLLKREASFYTSAAILLYFFNKYLVLNYANTELEIIIVNLVIMLYVLSIILKTRQEYQEICSLMRDIEDKVVGLNAKIETTDVSLLSSDQILAIFSLIETVERYAGEAFEDKKHDEIPAPLAPHLQAFLQQLEQLKPIISSGVLDNT